MDAALDHVRREQLYALLNALRHEPPVPLDEDPELLRVVRELPDAFAHPLAPEHRLGPDTVARLVAHGRACSPCRILLLEDGPGARPPRTEADVAAEARAREAARSKKVRRFWTGTAAGTVAFVGLHVTIQAWRDRNAVTVEPDPAALRADPREKVREIDPLLLLALVLLLVAAFAFADAYVIARELWIDFTRWKRAVPIIGKRWAEGERKARGLE